MYLLNFRMPRYFLVLLCIYPIHSWAQQTLPIPAPPNINATNYLLLDFNSGRVLAELGADETHPPASITKLMTAYVVFTELKAGHASMSDLVNISEKAWRTPGSRMFVEVGSKVRLQDLIKGMIIQSGNDATVALAEHIAGSEETFSALMNRYAKKLGLNNTQFRNSTGLPSREHFSSVRDIAVITKALIDEFPEYYDWYSQKKFTYNNISQYNRNKLLWRDPTVDGVKTGHTDAAGYCLVSSAQRNGMRLIAVVLGSDNEKTRADASQSLLNYGYRFFESRRLYRRHDPLSTPRVWKGLQSNLPVGLEDDLYITISRGRYADLKAELELNARIVAPVSAGESMGKLKVTLMDQTVAERPLIALNSVEKGPIWTRIKDEIVLMFQD